ncbi:MAG: TonB-dependent receptor plug domain-containing protein [Candidatus Pseudobacter hemicellulosilyticus]|uniref:TonB-dependent receptor plug domain-containing protein n=1 Tax=Candidatus Pseudobacter hemicellulosilyticus TaxID=3121375 RepID=A0AAJ5WNE6_9BACT|nr:MAG: TonB-dependent receptor plug domain-containing protein [Pseudobacter sp.]
MKGNSTNVCCVGFLVLLVAVLGCLPCHAQLPVLRVLVLDELEQPLPKASISINDNTAAANDSGSFRKALPAGRYKVTISAVNYHPFTIYFRLAQDSLLTVQLRPEQQLLNDVVVTDRMRSHGNQMGVQTLSITQIQKLPVILGEVDPLKTITLLPGVKSGGDASSGIYVRGGGPDQNLVLLNGIPVYNPNHLLGFFSVFNGDAIKKVEVIKGGMPAEYGGRLSSVINVETRDGHRDSLKGSGGIGLISSRLSLEGPIQKGRSSFIVSARRTYIDQVARLIAPDSIGRNGYYFYDINATVDYSIDSSNKLQLTFYTGKDDFRFVDDDDDGPERTFNANWGNTLIGLRWKQQLRPRLSQQWLLVRNQFNLDSRLAYGSNSTLFSSGLTDHQLMNDWNLTTGGIKWKGGLQFIRHQFRPGAGSSNAGLQAFKTQIHDQYAHEAAAYLSMDMNILPELNMVAGLRYSYFNQVGPTERILYGADGVPTGETETFARGESIARYHYPEPRISLWYSPSREMSVKLSYAKTIQYLHLATTSSATFPSDLWVPVSQRIKPGIAQQWSAGYYLDPAGSDFGYSVEAYYKTLRNQVEFKPGAELLLNQNLEGEMIFGSGKAYGIELLVRKKWGRLNGWLGYTLSRAERQYAELNNGKPFPYRYDRTHDLSLVAMYRLSKKWEASMVFVYGTGNALTLPSGRFLYNLGYNMEGRSFLFTNIETYDKINAYRMPAYHRMDIGFTYTPKPNSTKRYRSSWTFSLYNIYNRYNPYFIYFDVEEDDNDTRRIQGKKVFLFPIIPGITWNFKW